MAKKKKNKYTVNILWKDRRRRLGMPLSFQRYRLGEDRLFYEKGFLNTSVDDILLYRVRDISVKISFWQRLTGVGTVTVNSSDHTMPVLVMRDIKRPREVKEMLHQQVEKAKIAYRVRYNEMFCALPPLPILNLNFSARSPFRRTVFGIIIYNPESGAYKKLM